MSGTYRTAQRARAAAATSTFRVVWTLAPATAAAPSFCGT
jgi:hypothetical protein